MRGAPSRACEIVVDGITAYPCSMHASPTVDRSLKQGLPRQERRSSGLDAVKSASRMLKRTSQLRATHAHIEYAVRRHKASLALLFLEVFDDHQNEWMSVLVPGSWRSRGTRVGFVMAPPEYAPAWVRKELRLAGTSETVQRFLLA